MGNQNEQQSKYAEYNNSNLMKHLTEIYEEIIALKDRIYKLERIVENLNQNPNTLYGPPIKNKQHLNLSGKIETINNALPKTPKESETTIIRNKMLAELQEIKNRLKENPNTTAGGNK